MQVKIHGNDIYHDLSKLPPWTPNSTYIQCGMFEGQKAVFGEEGTVGLWYEGRRSSFLYSSASCPSSPSSPSSAFSISALALARVSLS